MLPGQGWGWGRRDPFSCVLANLGIAVGIRQVPTANAESGDMDWDAYQAQSAMRRPASIQSVIPGFMDSPNRPAQRASVVRGRQDKTRQALSFPADTTLTPPKSRQLSFSRLSASRQPPAVACSWYPELPEASPSGVVLHRGRLSNVCH